MGVKHRGHTEPAGAPRRRFAGCSAVGRWGMRDGFRFVPAADAPSQTQSIPSAAPAALCVALCCQNAGRGRDGGRIRSMTRGPSAFTPCRAIYPEIRKNRKEEWSNSRNPLIGRGTKFGHTRRVRAHLYFRPVLSAAESAEGTCRTRRVVSLLEPWCRESRMPVRIRARGRRRPVSSHMVRECNNTGISSLAPNP